MIDAGLYVTRIALVLKDLEEQKTKRETEMASTDTKEKIIETTTSTGREVVKLSEREIQGILKQATPQGLRLPANLKFDDWTNIGRFLHFVADGQMWWLGDWLYFGEGAYKEKQAQYDTAIEITGYSRQTCMNAKFVSSKIELARRKNGLSYNHHVAVAGLPPDVQDELLNKAYDEKLNIIQLRALVKQKRGAFEGRTIETTARNLDGAAYTVAVKQGDKYLAVERDRRFETEADAHRYVEEAQERGLMMADEMEVVPIANVGIPASVKADVIEASSRRERVRLRNMLKGSIPLCDSYLKAVNAELSDAGKHANEVQTACEALMQSLQAILSGFRS